MNSPLSRLQKEAYNLALTSGEKARMRANLMKRVRANSDASAPRSAPGLYYFFSPQFSMPLAGLLVLILGAGTTYAAQGALPGDALYTIKVQVNEPIQGALAFSTEDKIRFHSKVAQTRLEEAEMLASQDRLGSEASQVLESSIEVHIAERQTLASKLDEEKLGAGSKEIARLDTSITAHSDILVQLGEGSSSTTTKENSNKIAMRVRSNNANARYAYGSAQETGTSIAMSKAGPEDMEDAPAPAMLSVSLTADDIASTSHTTLSQEIAIASATEDSKHSSGKVVKESEKKDSSRAKAALSLGKRATSTLLELKAKVESMENIDEDTEERLDSRFGKIEHFISLGEEALTRGDFEEARDHFDEALDREATLSVFIQASIKFNKGILGNLLNNDSRWGND